MKMLPIAAIGAALALSAPAMAACPAGETAPLCETGHFAFFSANIGNGCFKVINTDTGDLFAIQPAVTPNPVDPTATGATDILAQGGLLTVRSTGLLTSCGPKDDGPKFFQIIAVRGAPY